MTFKSISKYMKKIGSKGGKKSRRVLTPIQAQKMVAIREQNRRSKVYITNPKMKNIL